MFACAWRAVWSKVAVLEEVEGSRDGGVEEEVDANGAKRLLLLLEDVVENRAAVLAAAPIEWRWRL